MLKNRIMIFAMAASGLLAQPALAQDGPPPAGPGFSGAEPELEFVFEEVVTLASAIAPGTTARGQRNIIPITGGTFEGAQLRGEILPGGWDWQLGRDDGCTDVVADYFLKTDDGAVINVRNTGAICPPEPGQPFVVRTHPVFEAPLGKYDWLGKTTFIGTLALEPTEDGTQAIRIKFYRVN